VTEVFRDEPVKSAKKVDEVNQVFQVLQAQPVSQVWTDKQVTEVFQVHPVILSAVIQVHQVLQVLPVFQESVKTDDRVNEVQQVTEVQWVQPELKGQSVHQAFAIQLNASQADSTDHQPLVRKVTLKKTMKPNLVMLNLSSKFEGLHNSS
jgi:hypothetical protein